jgi:hypothetical protein
MNLNQIIESDLSFTLEDNITGFGYEFTLIDDSLTEYEVKGRVNDIGFFVDLESGLAVTGRNAEITIRISSIDTMPRKDWKCSYTDTNDNTYTLFVATSPKVDRTLGVYLITLGVQK